MGGINKPEKKLRESRSFLSTSFKSVSQSPLVAPEKIISTSQHTSSFFPCSQHENQEGLVRPHRNYGLPDISKYRR
jgi:hypothetical protein